MPGDTLNVAIIGLEFGAEFIPIYQAHPRSEMYAICQRTQSKLDEVGDRFGVAARYSDYTEMLADPAIDVVHINTPVQFHAEHAIAALEAGKHVGCTVPMGTTVDECRRIVDAQRASGRVYMMMETVIFSREFLFVKEQYDAGLLGRLQFLRASHHQDMTGWPSYWDGLPPMYYATHVIAPTLAIADHQAEYVSCLGSGAIFTRMLEPYGAPYAVESAHIGFKDSDVGAEVTRHLWATARQYRESFDVFGAKQTFEWSQVEGEGHVIHTGETPRRVRVPDYAHLLPAEIQAFTGSGVYTDSGDSSHRSFVQGGGHGGSHPHLAHALLMAAAGEAKAYPDAVRAANITCAGILAHESAMNGGARIDLPEWTLVPGLQPREFPLDEDIEPPWGTSQELRLTGAADG
jgi:predicted dehydrogenase